MLPLETKQSPPIKKLKSTLHIVPSQRLEITSSNLSLNLTTNSSPTDKVKSLQSRPDATAAEEDDDFLDEIMAPVDSDPSNLLALETTAELGQYMVVRKYVHC